MYLVYVDVHMSMARHSMKNVPEGTVRYV
jgi:hypothetical protein